jgi:hypothetical protein
MSQNVPQYLLPKFSRFADKYTTDQPKKLLVKHG